MVPIYIPLLLPLTVIAIPLADLLLAVVRRTWAGKSPFAADRQHLHHRLLEIGHSHSRAVLIMYFWSALIAFGTVAFSVGQTEALLVKIAMTLCLLGILLLLLPRFKPHAPRIAERFLPPRYRRTAADEPDAAAVESAPAPERTEEPVLSTQDEELLRKIGTGAHASGGHSGVSGRNSR
jgi:UDP-GlcNAc:undecaprenyl-phosphate GlcNAc-1-phosphate transferase